MSNNPYPRYTGATNYTSIGADETNGVVALWSNNGDISGAQHLSVRKPGNNHPHGYDWESKPGGLMRTFHPRDALSGGIYGAIIRYFRLATPTMAGKINSPQGRFTFEESVKNGLTVIQKVKLNEFEKDY
ncbi:MAG: hypothetical protein HC905_31335 [Bacteroidales bacterium]|nr:hypothetical protein [Bacteroidales bacterium]